jgi:chromosome segregation ATPase
MKEYGVDQFWIEQKTEPIPVTRIEVASSDVLEQLKSIDKKLDRIDKKQDEHATGLRSHSGGISTLQTEMQGVKADTLAIRESQADIRDRVVEIKGTMTAMATKDDIASIKATQEQIPPVALCLARLADDHQ